MSLLLLSLNAVAQPMDIGEAKKQVFNLLDIINERNAILREKMPDAITDVQKIEDAVKPTNASSPSSTATLAYVGGVRDPFSATNAMYAIANDSIASNEGGGAYSGFDFKSPGLAVRLPKLSLKGVVYKSSQSDPLALLDVAGYGVYMVRLEDEIGFNPSDPSQVIKIKKINRLNIIVEVGTLGDLIVVR